MILNYGILNMFKTMPKLDESVFYVFHEFWYSFEQGFEKVFKTLKSA